MLEAWLLSETCAGPLEGDGFVLGFSGHEVAELIDAAAALGQTARSYPRETWRTRQDSNL